MTYIDPWASHPRVGVTLDDFDFQLAHDVAEKRESVPRTSSKANRTGVEGFRTHLQGAIAEIAVCRTLDAEFNPVYGKSDGGIDLITPRKKQTVNVKSTYVFRYGVKLFSMPDEDTSAQFQVLCCVDVRKGYVEVVGITTTQRLLAEPLRLHRSGEEWISCRWLTEPNLFPLRVSND